MRKDEYSVHLGMHGLKIRKKVFWENSHSMKYPVYFFFNFEYIRKKSETRVAVNGYCFNFFFGKSEGAFLLMSP